MCPPNYQAGGTPWTHNLIYNSVKAINTSILLILHCCTLRNMSNSMKRDISPSTEMSKRQAIFATPTRPTITAPVELWQNSCKTPSCSTPSNGSAMGLSNTRVSTPDSMCPTTSGVNTEFNTPVHFVNDSSLREDELLLYSLMTLVFPTQTFTKKFASNKYDKITDVMFQITGLRYSNHGIRNYFHRVRTNNVKGIGKTNGLCRWNYYQANVKSFIKSNNHLLKESLHDSEVEESTINSLMHQLTLHCTPQEERANTKRFNINRLIKTMI